MLAHNAIGDAAARRIEAPVRSAPIRAEARKAAGRSLRRRCGRARAACPGFEFVGGSARRRRLRRRRRDREAAWPPTPAPRERAGSQSSPWLADSAGAHRGPRSSVRRSARTSSSRSPGAALISACARDRSPARVAPSRHASSRDPCGVRRATLPASCRCATPAGADGGSMPAAVPAADRRPVGPPSITVEPSFADRRPLARLARSPSGARHRAAARGIGSSSTAAHSPPASRGRQAGRAGRGVRA